MNTIRGRFRLTIRVNRNSPYTYIQRTLAPLFINAYGNMLVTTGYDTMFGLFVVDPNFVFSRVTRETSSHWTDLS